jgi:glycosyltransferase involved in cell wall biosynthesis
MRIAIICDALDNQNSGIYQYTLQMVHALIKFDMKNEYILIHTKKPIKIEGAEQITVKNNTLFKSKSLLKKFYIIPQKIRLLNVDAVIEPAHFGPFCLPKNIKRITIIHDLSPILFPKFHPAYSVIAHKYLLNNFLKKTDYVITNSANTQRDVNRFFQNINPKMIYPGADKFYKSSKNKLILQKYNIEKKYILSVGTLEPRKNHLLLVKAFENLKKQSSNNLKLVLVGNKGWKNNKLHNYISKSKFKNDILIVGFISKEDLRVLYSSAEMMVYPSLYEGFGFPVLEAMQCNCPVITSNCSSLSEVGGNAVLYFKSNNLTSLTTKILELFLNPELSGKMILKGKQHANKFNWEVFVKKFIRIIKKTS